MVEYKRQRGKWSGFELPVVGGGISWTPGTNEREAVRRLVIGLEERRALYGDLDMEGEWYVADSIVWIRGQITEALKDLADGSEATRLLSQLRDDCNAYLTGVPDPEPGRSMNLRPHAAAALQRLRESFRVKLAYLGQGDLDRAAALARRIPHEIRSEALAEPPPEYPVRFSCRPQTEFDDQTGYIELFAFEAFNDSDRPVRVRSFGLDFTVFTSDEWHDREEATLERSYQFPVRLPPNDAVAGWVTAGDLPDRLHGVREHIVAYAAYVDVAGYGTKIVEVQEG